MVVRVWVARILIPKLAVHGRRHAGHLFEMRIKSCPAAEAEVIGHALHGVLFPLFRIYFLQSVLHPPPVDHFVEIGIIGLGEAGGELMARHADGFRQIGDAKLLLEKAAFPRQVSVDFLTDFLSLLLR